ncbi:MAG: adenylate kinase [Frankiaceae bacterium]|nr:adenylate kinase [Frankiaceae bacterium]MDQ1715073.1 adenylate kinase [Frankiaceae bacterium]
MRIVLLGAPGSGKGTQAKVLSEHYGIRHIGVGDVLRQAVRDGSAIGQQINEQLTRGDLVGDDVVLDVVWPLIVKAAREGGYVLDGFPRTLQQAEMAYEAAQRDQIGADAVVYLEAPREVLLERMLARAADRSDDVASVIEHRLSVFEERTHPLVEFYSARGLLVPLDASRPVADITAEIIKDLDARTAGK